MAISNSYSVDSTTINTRAKTHLFLGPKELEQHMVIGIHEHTLCPKVLLPVAEFPLSLWDWCGRLDDLEEKHLVPNQFDAQFHGVEEVQLVSHREKHLRSPVRDQEQH